MGNHPLPGSGEPVRLKNLGRLIRDKREAKGLTLEQVAQQSKVSIATLSRLESNSSIKPDTRTLTALSAWLGVPVEQLLGSQPTTESLPDIVDAHLRASRELDAEDAKLLARMFRSAYEAYASKPKSQDKGTNGSANEP